MNKVICHSSTTYLSRVPSMRTEVECDISSDSRASYESLRDFSCVVTRHIIAGVFIFVTASTYMAAGYTC